MQKGKIALIWKRLTCVHEFELVDTMMANLTAEQTGVYVFVCRKCEQMEKIKLS